MRTPLVGLVLAALVVGGCGVLVGRPNQGTSSSCDSIPSGACTEQTGRIAARHSGATDVSLTCTAPVCNRAAGSGTAVIRLANGSTTTEPFAYRGDPNPLPSPSCTGVPLDTCRHIATSTGDDQPSSQRITAIAVACATAPCRDDKGEVSILVTFADGTMLSTRMGWEGALP